MIELRQPTFADIGELVRQTFAGIDHPPFESPEEMVDMTLHRNDEVLRMSLFIVLDGAIVGLVRNGLYADKPSILQFNLQPPFDTTERAMPILQELVAMLRRAWPELTYAVYEDRFRGLFEAFGCQLFSGVVHDTAPLVRRPLPTSLAHRLVTVEDIPRLGDLMVACYGVEPAVGQALAARVFNTTYAAMASFVGTRADGTSLAAASLISGRKGQLHPLLEHIITHPEEQRKGWGATLVQSSMNVLLDLGCLDLTGIATDFNDNVSTFRRHFGFAKRGSSVYVGTLPTP